MLMSALKPLAELENAAEFVARHIGIDADDETHMLSVIGAASRRALIEQHRAAHRSRAAAPMRLPAPLGEAEALAELKAIAAQNRVAEELHRPGLPRHAHAGRDPAQRAREPGLVHRLHALPGRDLAGPAGGAGQLPDHGLRPDRHGDRQRVDARRGDRRRRGDDARQAQRQERKRHVLRRRRRPSADDRGDAHARRSRSASGRARQLGRGMAAPDRRRRLLRRAGAVPGDERRSCTTCAPTRRGSTPTARPSSSPPTCSR